MSEPFGRLRRFLRELKRRNVYQVAATYAVVGFVLVQIADLTFVRLGLPSWTVTLVIVLVAMGFPLALVLAWAFEMSPEGVRRTPEILPSEEPAEEQTERPRTRRAVQILAALGLVAVVGAGIWQLTPPDGKEGSAASGSPRIVVLPFENIARDSSNGFFARGLHAAVMGQLSKVSGLAVLSRKTALEMADSDLTPIEIGRRRDADAILEGSVLRDGERLRMTSRLIDAESDEQLWSNTYRRRTGVDEIIDIQADLATKVAEALETRLTDAERARIEERPTSSIAAYDAFLRGRNHYEGRYWETLTSAPIDSAVVWLRKAIRRDPDFAEAHAYLAEAYRQRAFFSSGEERWLDSTRSALGRARVIDPQVPEIHWVQGFLSLSEDSLQAAGKAFRRALDLQPSNAVACSGLASLRKTQGRLAEAVTWAYRAYRLEPRRPFRLNEMGGLLASVGMLDAAEAWQRRALSVNRDHLLSVAGLSWTRARREPERGLETIESFLERHPRNGEALRIAGRFALEAGRPQRARDYLERIADPKPRPSPDGLAAPSGPIRYTWRDRMVLALAEVELGNEDVGNRMLREAMDATRARFSGVRLVSSWGKAVWLAAGQTALGDEQEALRTLERSLRRSTVTTVTGFDLTGIQSSPVFDDLRSHPRFREIVREVEVRREEIREEVRQLDVPLYPPGAEPDSPGSRARSDDRPALPIQAPAP